MNDAFCFRAEVWRWTGGTAGWHFISVPEAVADDIDARYGHRAGGFGSLRVDVTIGTSRWQTSIFPDQRRGTYVLPVKKAVRAAEGLADGTRADVALTVIA